MHGDFDAASVEAELEAEADLPPPAYQPQPIPQPVASRPMPAAIEANASEFVAPRPRSAGQPTPEALARLQAAVSKPQAGAAPKFGRPAPINGGLAAAPAPAPAPAAKPRFGIGSLINRMAGGYAEAEKAAPAPGRVQPPVTAFDDDHDMGSDQDRIEIPAFLRRQAN
ncbi:MAG: cell division protein FtsZ, partial [Tabrizicola sp.]|nr:cell division protein FtsZ [Tabrizicola sp.]